MTTIKQKAKTNVAQVAAVIQREPSFLKAQLLKSNKYSHRRDALSALLEDNKYYSSTEVDEILNKFEGGKQ